MGSKPSHALPSNRPESGGADPDEQREQSGLLERDKDAFAKSRAKEREEEHDERKPGHRTPESDER